MRGLRQVILWPNQSLLNLNSSSSVFPLGFSLATVNLEKYFSLVQSKKFHRDLTRVTCN